MKEYIWVLEVAFYCWLEHSSVFAVLSWHLLLVYGRFLVTDISTVAPFGPGAKSLSWPFSTIYGLHLNSIFSPGNRPMIAFSSVTQSCPPLCDPWTAACQASLSITISWTLLKLMSIKSVMPSNHVILCHPLLLLPSISASIIVFSSESVLRIRCESQNLWLLWFRGSPKLNSSAKTNLKLEIWSITLTLPLDLLIFVPAFIVLLHMFFSVFQTRLLRSKNA